MTAEKALLLMSDIIKILVGAIKEFATGIGQGLSSLVVVEAWLAVHYC